MPTVRTIAALSLTLATALLSLAPLRAQTPAPAPFQVEEASIPDIHAAFRGGRLTCRALVSRFQRRFYLFARNGQAGNAL